MQKDVIVLFLNSFSDPQRRIFMRKMKIGDFLVLSDIADAAVTSMNVRGTIVPILGTK